MPNEILFLDGGLHHQRASFIESRMGALAVETVGRVGALGGKVRRVPALVAAPLS